jgi:hypothetical protein
MRCAGLLCCATIQLGLVRAEPTPADAALTISTDRPSVADYSPVVPPGALQVESGLTVTDMHPHTTVDFPEALVRYGLLAGTELRLTLPNYFHDLPVSNGAATGFGDMTVGVKQELGQPGGFDLLLIPLLSLPTGAESISSHGYDPGLLLPWSRSLSAKWTVAGQLASYWPTVDGKRNYTAEATLLLDRQLTTPWDAFVEYVGDFPQRGGSRQLLHVGTAYKLSAHQQIDLHAGIGLSDAAPRSFVGVGYSCLLLTQ